MYRLARLTAAACLAALTLAAAVPDASAEKTAAAVRWRKTVVDPAFRSEGVAVADVDRDGRVDILVGDYWYQAPNWERREIRPPRTDLGDGANTYSDAFACFTGDFNGDRWPDLLVVDSPGKAAFWYENPGESVAAATTGHWKRRPVAPSVCNETTLYTDLFGDGRKVLIAATQPEGQMCWFAPSADPEKPWERHAVSAPGAKAPGTEVYSHGLGTGDVNGDGRADILVKEGWWEQPAGARTSAVPWTFHPANLGEDCANLHVLDVNGDGRPDVFSSSAHRRGVWWHEQRADGTFMRHLIDDTVTQTHALNLVDIDGDGRKDLITGKRRWAHGPGGDIDPGAAPVLHWFEIQPGKGGTPLRFVRHRVDDDSGVGTQFVCEDVNGDRRPDIVVSNKRGVFLFEQISP